MTTDTIILAMDLITDHANSLYENLNMTREQQLLAME